MGDGVGMDAANLRILMSLDSSGVRTGALAATAAVASMESGVVRSLGRMRTAFLGLSTAQVALGAFGVGAALVGTALVATIAPAVRFESAFAGVRKTVEGTPAVLEEVRQDLLQLSRVMPVSAVQLASIAENAGALGVEAPQIANFTREVAQLGATTDLSFDSAAQSLARFLNITDGGVEDIAGASAVLVDLGNNSATTESQILTFATRIAGAGTAAGAAKEELLSIAAFFSSVGVQAELGGSAVSRVFNEIAEAAAVGGSELEIFASTAGVLPEEFARIAEEDPSQAFVLFAQGLERVREETGTVGPTLEALGLQGIRLRDVLTRAALGSDELAASIARGDQALEDGSAAYIEYARRLETTESRLRLLQNRLTAVAITAGTPLLDGVAVSADTAGDAIEALAELLTPLAVALGGTFENAARAAGLFFDVIGGPALGVAVAGLTGLSLVASGVLDAFNQLGPVGLILALLVADLALFGPLTAAAYAGMAAFSAATATATGPLVAFRAALVGVQAALAAGPLILAVGLITAIGAAYISAGRQAREAGQDVRDGFGAAIEDIDYDGIISQIDAVETRMARLGEIDRVPDELSLSFDALGQSFTNLIQIVTPFTDNTIANARAELQELQRAAEENGFGTFEDDISKVAGSLGITNEAAFALAVELGVLEQLTAGTQAEFFTAAQTMEAFALQADLSTTTLGSLFESTIQGTATLEDFANAAELTVSQLAFVAAATDDVELNDLIEGDTTDRWVAFLNILDQVDGRFSTLAADAGLTTAEFIDQAAATLGLADAHNALRSAIDGVINAYALIDEQQRIAAESQQAFADGLAEFDGSEESLIALGLAGRQATAEFAGLASTTSEAAAFQAEIATQFATTAREAGYSEEAIREMLVAFVLLNDADLAQIIEQSLLLEEQNRRTKQSLDDTAGEYVIGLSAEDRATEIIENARGTAEAYKAGQYLANIGAIDAATSVILMAQGTADAYKAGAYEATIGAIDAATPTISAAASGADAYKAGEYVATIGAIDAASAVIAIPQAGADAYKNAVYNANLTATDSASGVIGSAQSGADAYKAAQYVANIQATDNASAVIAVAQRVADAFDVGDYDAQLFATDNASRTIAIPQSNADRYDAGTYLAQLYAQDNASGTILTAVRNLARFVSRTVTLTTVHRTVYSQQPSGPRADGAFTPPAAMVPAFNDGAMVAPILEKPSLAKIYAPVTRHRTFAEPETGGEAWIPLAQSKRARSMEIWKETGRHFGLDVSSFNDGGLVASRAVRGAQARLSTAPGYAFSISAPISVNVNALPGMDVEALARRSADMVAERLDELGTLVRNSYRR